MVSLISGLTASGNYGINLDFRLIFVQSGTRVNNSYGQIGQIAWKKKEKVLNLSFFCSKGELKTLPANYGDRILISNGKLAMLNTMILNRLNIDTRS